MHRSGNRFAILQNEEENQTKTPSGESKSNSAENASEVNKLKIPPIVLLNKTAEFARTLIKQLDSTFTYTIKLASIGVKIIATSEQESQSLRELLIKNNCEFFTYLDKHSRPLKIVLSGLHQMPAIELYEELRNLQIHCEDVKLMKLKFKRYEEQSNYLLYFRKGTVKLSELRKTRTIFNTIVKWDFYKKPFNTFTQCRNCQMFGHGQNNCNVKPKCALCSGSHLTSECTNPDVTKCTNCGGNHKAYSQTCPKRLEYISLREKLRLKNSDAPRTRTTTTTKQYEPAAPANDTTNFPQLTTRKQVTANTNKPALASTTTNVWVPSPPQLCPTTSNELFSPEELIKITTELITKLRLCKTKEEQFQVVTTLAIQYVYK